MRADVVRLDLRLRRRAVLGYTLGMALYVFIVVAIYPAFQNETTLNDLTKNGSKLAALFGATGSLTSPSGWMNANIYANFLPLIVLVLTMGYGAAAVAGQDEDGTLALVTTLPLRRRAVLGEKVAVLVAHALAIMLVTTVFAFVGRGFQVALAPSNLLTTSVGVTLLGVDFGLLALAIGALTGSRGAALGIASAVAAASYLVSSLAPVTRQIRPLRFGSLFYWAVGNDQLARGLSLTSLCVLSGVALVLGFAALRAFERFDVH